MIPDRAAILAWVKELSSTWLLVLAALIYLCGQVLAWAILAGRINV